MNITKQIALTLLTASTLVHAANPATQRGVKRKVATEQNTQAALFKRYTAHELMVRDILLANFLAAAPKFQTAAIEKYESELQAIAGIAQVPEEIAFIIAQYGLLLGRVVDLADYPNTIDLDLSKQCIRDIVRYENKSHTLRKLNLDGNFFTTVPEHLALIPSLENISLESNPLDAEEEKDRAALYSRVNLPIRCWSGPHSFSFH